MVEGRIAKVRWHAHTNLAKTNVHKISTFLDLVIFIKTLDLNYDKVNPQHSSQSMPFSPRFAGILSFS